MARPIEFVREEVITRATEQFWKDGYVASSVQLLLDATGINRGTLYNSFGEKVIFFRICVAHYNSLLNSQMEATLGNAALTDKASIYEFFKFIISGVPATQRHYGCLLVSSQCESINWDSKLSKLVRDSLQLIRKALLQRVRELEKSRGLAAGVSSEFAADNLLQLYSAIKVASRAGRQPKQLLEQANFSLAALLK